MRGSRPAGGGGRKGAHCRETEAFAATWHGGSFVWQDVHARLLVSIWMASFTDRAGRAKHSRDCLFRHER
jgi:hypothetical protein